MAHKETNIVGLLDKASEKRSKEVKKRTDPHHIVVSPMHLEEALGKVVAKEEFTQVTVKVSGSGLSYCVSVGESDNIFFAKRGKRPGFSKMVLGREPEATNLVTVLVLWSKNRNCYVLITAYYGEASFPEVNDARFHKKSKKRLSLDIFQKAVDFWENRALIPVPGLSLNEKVSEEPKEYMQPTKPKR